MREIKFRAWDNTQKYMAYQGTPDLETISSFFFHFGEDILMQYVGLKDKNGKEIYEGDICRRLTGYTFWVKVREYLLGEKNNAKAFGYDWHESDEVIGNIYQNSELLTPQ